MGDKKSLVGICLGLSLLAVSVGAGTAGTRASGDSSLPPAFVKAANTICSNETIVPLLAEMLKGFPDGQPSGYKKDLARYEARTATLRALRNRYPMDPTHYLGLFTFDDYLNDRVLDAYIFEHATGSRLSASLHQARIAIVRAEHLTYQDSRGRLRLVCVF
jgi:hypothetical protein